VARNVADLVVEMEELGLTLTPEMTDGRGKKSLMMDALAVAKNEGVDLLPQIDVMLCRDAKEWIEMGAGDPFNTAEMELRFWANDQWVAEEKLDGNRLKMHLTSTGIRSDSRRRSDETYVFSEKTGNFPHIEQVIVPFLLQGTVLDGEVICPKPVVNTGSVTTSSTQQSTSAIANSGKEKAIKIQRDNDAWVEFHAFDVIRFAGEDVTDLPYEQRRLLLEEIIDELSERSEYFKITRVTDTDKLEFMNDILAKGGEGIILKDKDGFYEEGKRSKTHYKLKTFTTQDGYITGWIPGEGANTGYVGAVTIACRINGVEHEFASVSQFTQEQRVEMTRPHDGSLRPEYYGDVVEVRGQVLTKNGRFQHAVFLGWRPDKDAEDCDGYELASDLEALGFTFGV